MDGVTDHVYRDLMTARARPGALAFCVSEFLRVTARPLPPEVIRRSCPEVATDGRTRAGVPVIVQLLGGAPEPLAETARRAIALGAHGVDLNFGCPAKTVNRHDGGATLLKTPERVEAIVARVRDAVPGRHPVSAKIRLGWESHDEVVPLALAAERGGATFLTIHGRTKREMYGPPADWTAIGRARRAVGIPVIANGDLNDDASFAQCREESGCAHFMLGRGPMGRPSLLVGATPAEPGHELPLLAELLSEYLELMTAAGVDETRRVGRVKQWLSLGRAANPEVTPLFERVKRIMSAKEMSGGLRDGNLPAQPLPFNNFTLPLGPSRIPR
jgi:tRNA-dihydrouridine synthase C